LEKTHTSGDLKNGKGTTQFMWWIRKTTDDRWSINMWGEGVEMVKGVPISSRTARASQNLTIKKWEDLEMNYMLSYDNGLNVSFKAKHVTPEDIKGLGPIPTVPIKMADRTILFEGDDLKNSPVEISCGFQ
jgi:hypothetical protein